MLEATWLTERVELCNVSEHRDDLGHKRADFWTPLVVWLDEVLNTDNGNRVRMGDVVFFYDGLV